MAVRENGPTFGQIFDTVEEMRGLIREELDLMRAEVSEEARHARAGTLAMAVAGAMALLGLALLSVALGGAISQRFGWPAWAGYGVVALLEFAGAGLGAWYGRRRLARVRALPRTRASFKEHFGSPFRLWRRARRAHQERADRM